MILVTGSTGHFGKAAIDFLLQKNIPASSIAALVRDDAKAADLKAKGIVLRKGDYNNYASLVEAFRGVDKLLFVSSNEMENRSQQQVNTVNAAKEAGVKHIVYTSLHRRHDTGLPIQELAQGHIDTEAAIKASGIPYTLMRNTVYADMLPIFMGEQVLNTGVFLPAGNGRAAFATRHDMAEAAAIILSTTGHENKAYDISADANYSFADVAQMLTELSGKQVAYVSPDVPTYMNTVTAAGMPAEYAGLFAGFSDTIAKGELESDAGDLERLLGRKPMALKAYLKSVYFQN